MKNKTPDVLESLVETLVSLREYESLRIAREYLEAGQDRMRLVDACRKAMETKLAHYEECLRLSVSLIPGSEGCLSQVLLPHQYLETELSEIERLIDRIKALAIQDSS